MKYGIILVSILSENSGIFRSVRNIRQKRNFSQIEKQQLQCYRYISNVDLTHKRQKISKIFSAHSFKMTNITDLWQIRFLIDNNVFLLAKRLETKTVLWLITYLSFPCYAMTFSTIIYWAIHFSSVWWGWARAIHQSKHFKTIKHSFDFPFIEHIHTHTHWSRIASRKS